MNHPWWEKYKVDVPDGECGIAKVDTFTAGADDSSLAIHNMKNPAHHMYPGTFKRLRVGGRLMMSDTFAEIRDNMEAIRQARGRCLVNGLGLGVVVNGMLMKPEVMRVTVVELSEDVIKLVGDHWKDRWGDGLEIIHADALDFRAPTSQRYDTVWHDIWPDICTDNLKEIGKLHRKYGRRCRWQSSWQRDYLQMMRERERHAGW